MAGETAVLIVAAGSGHRAGGLVPKQFQPLLGQPVLRRSVWAFAEVPEIAAIQIVTAKGLELRTEEAIRGMLPKTKMGDAMYRKLKVYAGADHPHTAQQPKQIEVA